MSLRNPLWLISRVMMFGALFVGYSVLANVSHPLNLLAWTTIIAPDMNRIFPVLIGVGMVTVVAIWLGKQAQQTADDASPVSEAATTVDSPPSDLPPGSAGMLVAGELRPAHITAQVIDLARRGAITLTQTSDDAYFVAKVADFKGDTDRTDRLLLDAIGSGDPKSLTSVMASAARDHIRLAGYLRQTLQAQGLLRKQWSFFNIDPTFAFWLAWATIVLMGMSRGLSGSPFRPNPTAPFPILLYGQGTLWLLYGIFGQTGGEPLSQAGVQARKQWRAFYNWLMRSQADAESDVFERYLPYAIALGAQARWVEKHASAGSTAAPVWYRMGPPRTAGASTGGGVTMRGSSPAPISPPSLNDMSASIFSGLDQASQGLFGMLNAGATAFQRNIPSAPSGGGGGSGFGGSSRSSSGWGSSSLSRGSSRRSTSLSKSRPSSASRGSSSMSRSRRGSSIGGSRRGSSSIGRSSRGSSSFRKSSSGRSSGGFRRK